MAEEKERLSRLERRQREADARQSQQLRMIRLIGGGIIALIVLILGAALIVEFFVTPTQAVARLDTGTEVLLGDWQEQVRFQRARLISDLEEQLELFTDEEAEDPELAEQEALRFVQQFSGQQIGFLAFAEGSEQLGEFVLDRMVEDAIIAEEAAARGIAVTESEIDALIGQRYNFYDTDTGLPTPFPTSTATVQPTPSLTPISFETPDPDVPTATPTEVLPTSEPLPTTTPLPTRTPVSRESFEESVAEENATIDEIGGNSALVRTLAENDLLREKIADAIFEESDVATNVPHTSAYILEFVTEPSAQEQLAIIQDASYIEVWNTIRSLPIDFETETPVSATERLFQTESQYAQQFPPTVVEEIMNLGVGESSGVISGSNMQTGVESFYIVSISGREDRELSEASVDQLRGETFTAWIEGEILARATIFETWRGRVPRTPALDSKFSVPAPTVTPAPTALPQIDLPTVEPADTE